jgi:hypothetical protein
MQNWSICCKDEKSHSQLANVKVVTRKNRKAQTNTIQLELKIHYFFETKKIIKKMN